MGNLTGRFLAILVLTPSLVGFGAEGGDSAARFAEPPRPYSLESDSIGQLPGIVVDLPDPQTGVFEQIWANSTFQVGADYFRLNGGVNKLQLHLISNPRYLNRPLVSNVPEADPSRLAGYLEFDTALPLSRGGGLGAQMGLRYNQAELGSQTFFTAGVFQRGLPRGYQLGGVYDGVYDDHLDFYAGQVRFQVSKNLNRWNEIGLWVMIQTNVGHNSIIVRTDDPNTPQIESKPDEIVTRFRSSNQYLGFWTKVWDCGLGESDPRTIFFGGTRNRPAEAQVIGTLLEAPMPWLHGASLVVGGHWSHHHDDQTHDLYVGVSFRPGGRSRACRYLPELPTANNTFLNVQIDPMYYRARGGIKHTMSNQR